MNEFIILHDSTDYDKKIIFNLGHILHFYDIGCWTNVYMTDETVLCVKESPDEILEIIRGGEC